MENARRNIHPETYIAKNATILGDVSLGKDCTVLFNATLRGDFGGSIIAGAGTNFQENVCVHVPEGASTILGNNVTVGHGAILHGCEIGDNTIVGMGAIVIDGARVGSNCLIGAGALVTGTANIPDKMLVLGSPARAIRPLTEEEIKRTNISAKDYIACGKSLAEQGVLNKGMV